MQNDKMMIVRRATILLAAIWFVGYFLGNRQDIAFSWTVLRSTPNTACSDLYSSNDGRLWTCESYGGGSVVDRIVKRERGEIVEVPVEPYHRTFHRPEVWLWWLGIPLALLLTAPALSWVLSGSFQHRQR